MPHLGDYGMGDDVTLPLKVTNRAGVPLAITTPLVSIRAQDNTTILASSAMVTTGEGTGEARYVFSITSALASRFGETFRVFYTFVRNGTRHAPHDTFRLSLERHIFDAAEITAITSMTPKGA